MYKPKKDKVAERLVLIRKELNLTIEAMGTVLGIPKGTINTYLTGRSLPDDNILDQICEMINVDRFWILYGNTEAFLLDYLDENKMESLIVANTELLKTMVVEFDNQYEVYQKIRKINFSEQVEIKFKIANKVTKKYYELEMKKLIKELLNKEIKDCQEHLSELYRDNISEDWIIEKILDEINIDFPKPKYGENDKIKELGFKKIGSIVFATTSSETEKLDHIIMPTLLEATIRQFGSESGIYEILDSIAAPYGIVIDKESEEYKKIVEKLKNNVGELMDILNPDNL